MIEIPSKGSIGNLLRTIRRRFNLVLCAVNNSLSRAESRALAVVQLSLRLGPKR